MTEFQGFILDAMAGGNIDSDIDNSRLGKCEVCQADEAKYTCPRCEVKTCCLKCVKIHKLEIGCNGERDKLIYKPVSKFSNVDLLSDYRLLEDISRSVDRYYRDPSKRYTRTKRELPYHLNQLRIAAMKRGCRLNFLPQNFTRHKSNSTFYDWKKDLISWKVDWIFSQAENLVMHTERLLETEKLSRAVAHFFDPEMERNSALQFYQSAGVNGVKFLLKAEGVKRSSARFYDLDPSLSLKSNLKGKFMVEFPTILIVMKEHQSMYCIIDSDEEEEEIPDVFFPGNIRGPVREQKPADSKSKNLLFNDEMSNSGSEDDNEEGDGPPKKKKFDIPQYDVLVRSSTR